MVIPCPLTLATPATPHGPPKIRISKNVFSLTWGIHRIHPISCNWATGSAKLKHFLTTAPGSSAQACSPMPCHSTQRCQPWGRSGRRRCDSAKQPSLVALMWMQLAMIPSWQYATSRAAGRRHFFLFFFFTGGCTMERKHVILLALCNVLLAIPFP